MCFPEAVTSSLAGANLTSLLVVLMEYPLPGPVIALLSQEKASLAPKSYLISSCKKSIKITLVYSKDQQTEEGQHLVPSAVASASGASVSAAAAAAKAVAAASTSKASSASSFMSSSSSLSSSAERKKPRHASSSSKTSRKKKKKNKNSRKSSRSTPSSVLVPRVSKLSESSTSPTSDLEALYPGAKGCGSAGTRNLAIEIPRKLNTHPGKDEDSCSTPEFPLLFGGDTVGRERMSTVDSGVPSSNGTMAYEQTAESGVSDEDHDTPLVGGTKVCRDDQSVRRDMPSLLCEGKPNPRVAQTSRKDKVQSRALPVDLPRRTRGISDSSISSLSSSDDEKQKGVSRKTSAKNTKSDPPRAVFVSTAATACASRVIPGSVTPVRREEQWQTWTRIPRTQHPPTSGRQKSMAVPTVSARPPTANSASGGDVSGVPRVPAQNNRSGATTGSLANQNEGGGASWDGSENL